MTKKKTSFGVHEVISDEPRVERMVFETQGRPHHHTHEHEHCYVLKGRGIVVGSDLHEVKEGDLCHIPAGTIHHMIPHETPFEVLIFYSAI